MDWVHRSDKGGIFQQYVLLLFRTVPGELDLVLSVLECWNTVFFILIFVLLPR